MIEAVLTIISGVIGIVVIIYKRRSSKKAIEKKRRERFEKAIARQNHIAKSTHVSDLLDELRRVKNRHNSR